jgi:(R,R)-butanediol dehydrogenase/meso-butanediol dehydrogenase/diacetyl reductase
MRAVRWHGRRDVRVDDVPYAPDPGPGQVRIAVAWTGICGTDREEWRSGPLFIPTERPHPLTGRVAPLTLGHEIAGHVEALGPDVTGLRAGDLVALDANLSCGTCWWCVRHQLSLCPMYGAIGLHADGGLADAVTVPAQMCLPVSSTVDADTAALAEPLSVAVRGFRRGRLAIDETVAIFGGGMIGLAALVVARAMGAGLVVVVDPIAERRALAVTLGADAALDPADPGFAEALKTLTAGRGPDVTMDAAGTPRAAVAAIGSVRRGGRAVMVGLSAEPATIDLFAIAAGEREVIGALSHIWDEDFAAAIHLLERGALRADQVVAARIALEDTVTIGFESIGRTDMPGVKVLVSPALAPAAAR